MIKEVLLLLTQAFLVVSSLLILGLLSSPVGGFDKRKFHEKRLYLNGRLSDSALHPRERLFMYLHRYIAIYFLYRWDLLILVCLGLSAVFYTMYLMIRGAI